MKNLLDVSINAYCYLFLKYSNVCSVTGDVQTATMVIGVNEE